MTNDIWHIPDVHISLHLTLSHPCSAPGWHPCDGFRSVWFHHKVKLTRVDTSGWSPFMTGEIAHQSRDSCTEGRHSQDHGTKGTGLHTLWYWTSLLVTLDITLCDTGLHTLWHWTSYLVTLDFTPCDTGLHTLWHWTSHLVTLDFTPCDTGLHTLWHWTSHLVTLDFTPCDTGLHTLWHWTSRLVTLDFTPCDTGLHTLWHWTSHLVTLDFTPCDTGLHTLWHWTSHLVTLDFTPCDTGLHTLCDIDASAKERGSPLSLHPCQCCSLSHRKHQGQHPPTFGVSFRHNSANQYYLVGYNGYNGYNGGWPSAR